MSPKNQSPDGAGNLRDQHGADAERATVVVPNAGAEQVTMVVADESAAEQVTVVVKDDADFTKSTALHFAETMLSAAVDVYDGTVPTASSSQSSSEHEEHDRFDELGLSAGRRIHQYELVRELGHGAMGRVFLARDVRLDRAVAIKFLIGNPDGISERFLVEARATARCHHPNIVVIHDVNKYQDFHYMVLEYLEGQSLKQLLAERGALPPVEAVELMLPVVRALVHAHEFGIVHRDLKPANVFVTKDGIVKVLDFGIAKLLSGGVEESAVEFMRYDDDQVYGIELTQQGMTLGTMPYMAPEQWRADKIDLRVDIWAVGVMLFEMVAGCHPLGKQSVKNLRRVADLDRPMPSLGEKVDAPGSLVRTVDACLRKFKDERIPTASRLLEELKRTQPQQHSRQAKTLAYDPELVSSLKRDHAELLARFAEIMGHLNEGEWERIPTTLTRFKSRLSAHLLTENTRFYKYLEQSLADDAANLELIRDFYEEMSDIAREVVRHLKTYQRTQITAENVSEFRATFEQIGILLGERIEREERDLYALYVAD